MKIKILKENFPNETPSGPSLGQPGPLNSSMPETKRKMMVLIDRIGKSLDELEIYENIYDDITNSFINLKPAPVIKNFNYVRDENGEKVYETLEETAFNRAKNITSRRGVRNITRGLKKTISQATTVSELLEDVNQYLQLIETIGVDRSLALYAKDVIYKDRSVHFKNAGTFISKLYNYGDYLAATGLAIESLTKVVPKLSNPGTGLAIKDIAESFTINFKSLWNVITQELTNSGDVLPSRREFMHAIEPEILKHLMKIKKPTSLYDLLEYGFMKKMIERFPIANTKAAIGGGAAKILLRRALHALGNKQYIVMKDGSFYYSPRASDEFILNPEMIQQAGEEYFQKPEGIMENNMKLTKQKLEQLILEQYKSMSRRIFDKRRQQMQGPGRARVVGNPDQPTNYPEYADKLTALAKTDPAQARELADALDEPLDIEFSGNTSVTFGHPSMGGVFNFEEMKQETWFDYVMTGYADNFEDPIDPNQFEKYANDKGISQDKKQEVYNKLESERSKLLQKLYINRSRTEHERTKELEDLYSLNLRPD